MCMCTMWMVSMMQTLTAEEIAAMRGDGGTAVVEALIQNSATYHEKSRFAQDKYKRRKRKKHAPRVVLRPANSLWIGQVCGRPMHTRALSMKSLFLLSKEEGRTEASVYILS